MLASKLLFKCLEEEGVEMIFGYPGGALLPIYDALIDSKIEHILVRNEQAAPHYASGYARETGKVGVCLATSGPGATNLITGIATAYLDSIPIVAITGQVNRDLIGTDAFQEADIFGATLPFVKHSYLVKNPKDIPRVVKEAFYIASTGRPGPVLIDIPRDVQTENLRHLPHIDTLNIPGYKPTYEGHTGQIKRVLRKIKQSKRPMIYAGGGVTLSGARDELVRLAEAMQAPVVTSFMGIGAFPQDHPLYAGIWGSHGYPETDQIVKMADMALCVGARMSNRGTSTEVLNQKEMIHIDIDPAEIGKNVNDTNIPVVGDAKTVLTEILEHDIQAADPEWMAVVHDIEAEHDKHRDEDLDPNLSGVNPRNFFRWLSDTAPEDTTLVADVGLNQVWAALHFQKTVIGVCGDGSFQMAMGELGVIAEHQLPLKLVVMNNGKLGMVRQQQHDNYGAKHHYSGTDINFNVPFVELAEVYGFKAYRATNDEEAKQAMTEALKQPGPTLVECTVDPDFIQF